ncbi:hypothetical protein LTR36_005080 [Oleoguttula mirabilis]|uniref:Mediator of RNA polymerase II transcription subunit 18 n=1 Tax=Oleoguttula mirabilis TaxID=1507867 RepID=A0AAV9JVL8_9PEZI|nr:hypothetical protein LTR36_005080 [Oleoguttula mirabilis]
MHEFLLYSQIPVARHEQVLHILAGVCAAQPTSMCQQHLIYQQLKVADAASKKGASAKQQSAQTQRPSYHKLLRDISSGDGEQSAWTFRAEDVPLPGMQAVISRPVEERVLDHAELEKFREGGSRYKYTNQFITPMERFVHNNVVIRVSRVLSVPEGTGALEPLDAPTPVLADCRPVDPSGSYLFEACVRVEDGTNSKLTEQAMSELQALKNQLEGAVDLRVPDRLSLDTRVKGA